LNDSERKNEDEDDDEDDVDVEVGEGKEEVRTRVVGGGRRGGGVEGSACVLSSGRGDAAVAAGVAVAVVSVVAIMSATMAEAAVSSRYWAWTSRTTP
jgi:hypothetical protein